MDNQAAAGEKFKVISEAYHCLIDTQKRVSQDLTPRLTMISTAALACQTPQPHLESKDLHRKLLQSKIQHPNPRKKENQKCQKEKRTKALLLAIQMPTFSITCSKDRKKTSQSMNSTSNKKIRSFIKISTSIRAMKQTQKNHEKQSSMFIAKINNSRYE